MRKILLILPLLLSANPALAQDRETDIKIPPELTDPAFADKLDKTMQGLTEALLDLKVGEVQAAVEGRQATQAEKKLRVRDMAGVDGQQLRRQIAQAGPKIAQSMNALSKAMPAMMKALDDASRAIDRAAANMPDPTYPKR